MPVITIIRPAYKYNIQRESYISKMLCFHLLVKILSQFVSYRNTLVGNKLIYIYTSEKLYHNFIVQCRIPVKSFLWRLQSSALMKKEESRKRTVPFYVLISRCLWIYDISLEGILEDLYTPSLIAPASSTFAEHPGKVLGTLSALVSQITITSHGKVGKIAFDTW